MSMRFQLGVSGVYLLLLSAGCADDPPPDGFGGVADEETCLQCHSVDGPLLSDLPDGGEPSATVIGHARHRAAGIGCEVCHIVPEAVGASTHIDDPPAEVFFSGKAASGGRIPVWNAVTLRCEGTYCHGGGLTGGTHSSPAFADPESAVLACTGCHGNPPTSGAHARHAEKGVACSECHRVPVDVYDPMHIDGAGTEVVLGGRAVLGGASAAFVPSSGTCINTYCHGATLFDGVNTAPTWAQPTGSAAACDSCHGNPPLTTHVAGATDCSFCHFDTVRTDGTIDEAGGYHLNGTVE